MTNFYFLVIFLSSIFVLILYLYLRTRNLKLTREDYYHWLRVNNRFRKYYNLANKNFILPFKNSLNFLFFNFMEKILRRIKIEALKLETWASQKIEKIREKRE